ncbi:MAG: isochorismatase family protein [Candidatus Rokuibacteriota bacterium]
MIAGIARAFRRWLAPVLVELIAGEDQMPDAREPHPMRLDRASTTLLVVDVQERLFPTMDADHREEVVRNIKILTTAARRLGLATVLTEQCPKALGHTLPELSDTLAPGVEPIAKVELSCGAVEGVRASLTRARTRSVVLTGIEAHVGVLMSALDLLAQGYAVHVAADAVTSRTQANWRLAMDQLRQGGAVVTSTETILFQLLGAADTEEFGELARLTR